MDMFQILYAALKNKIVTITVDGQSIHGKVTELARDESGEAADPEHCWLIITPVGPPSLVGKPRAFHSSHFTKFQY